MEDQKPDLKASWDDAEIDEAEAESFPASDPPAYTLGVERAEQKPPPVPGKDPPPTA